MAKYRIKKGYFQKPRKAKLLRKVFVVQKRLIWGIWLNVSSANAENPYYFRHEKQAIADARVKDRLPRYN